VPASTVPVPRRLVDRSIEMLVITTHHQVINVFMHAFCMQATTRVDYGHVVGFSCRCVSPGRPVVDSTIDLALHCQDSGGLLALHCIPHARGGQSEPTKPNNAHAHASIYQTPAEFVSYPLFVALLVRSHVCGAIALVIVHVNATLIKHAYTQIEVFMVCTERLVICSKPTSPCKL